MTAIVWSEVVRLPALLMQEARDLRDQAPIKAALRAQLAVAIGILTIAPVRLGNLARIKLEENLIRPAGPLSPYWLVFPNYDVKNRVKLEFDLKERLTKLIEEYVHDHRPVLLRGVERALALPGRERSPQDALDARRPDHRRGRGPGRHPGYAASVPPCGRGHDHASHAGLRARAPGARPQAPSDHHRSMLGLRPLHATERFGDIVRAQLAAGSLEGVSGW